MCARVRRILVLCCVEVCMLFYIKIIGNAPSRIHQIIPELEEGTPCGVAARVSSELELRVRFLMSGKTGAAGVHPRLCRYSTHVSVHECVTQHF